MVQVRVKYDGKVFVPVEPPDIRAGAEFCIELEPLEPATRRASRKGRPSLLGIGLEGGLEPNPRFPDDDSLWDYLDEQAGPPGQGAARDVEEQRR
jgi:hypothetical protein